MCFFFLFSSVNCFPLLIIPCSPCVYILLSFPQTRLLCFSLPYFFLFFPAFSSPTREQLTGTTVGATYRAIFPSFLLLALPQFTSNISCCLFWLIILSIAAAHRCDPRMPFLSVRTFSLHFPPFTFRSAQSHPFLIHQLFLL